MPKHSEYRRISITLPADVLAAADRMATESDRPRSRVIAEAVRAYAARDGVEGREPPGSDAPGTGPVARPDQSVQGEERLARLKADLARSREERVAAAEEVACVGLGSRGPGPEHLIGFARYADYLSWLHRPESPR